MNNKTFLNYIILNDILNKPCRMIKLFYFKLNQSFYKHINETL